MSTSNIISLSVAGIALIISLFDRFYKPNSLKATIGHITRKEHDYIIPITFVNSGYQSNAIRHVISNAYNEDPDDKKRSKGITLYQLDAFTLKPQDVITKLIKINGSGFGMDLHGKHYKRFTD